MRDIFGDSNYKSMRSKDLFRNEEISKIIFETTPDMLVIMNKDGKILDCNNHYAQNFGYDKSELLGMNGPVDMVSEKDRQKAVSAFGEVVSKGIKLNVSLEVIRKDGSVFPSIWSGAALHDKLGQLEGYLVTGKDLSEIHNLKNEIKKSKEENQKEKMVLLGQLTGRIAHDIRNPLSNIRMATELMKNSQPDTKISDSSIFEKLEIVSKNIERISHQVNDVLDFIRIRPPTKEKVLLSSCLSHTLENLSIPGNIKIKVNESDLAIFADPFQLQIVCTNLLVNSIQSIGEHEGKIFIRFSEDSEFVIIEIEDSGNGIPDEILPKLFEAMETTKQVGTGLGLVSCKNIIQNHGGMIYAKNNPTTFTIKLPKN